MPEAGVCLICGDVSLGRNYGVVSCFGCKAFFQRTVRKNLSYTCPANNNCAVEPRKRNKCRYCRLERCLAVGMRRDAVQEERDKILLAYNRKRSELSQPLMNESLVLSTPNRIKTEKLLEAELSAFQVAKCAKGAILNMEHFCGPDGQFNEYMTKLEGKKLEVMFAVEWSKHVPCFQDLDMRDQLTLLKAHAGELVLLDIVKRSISAPDNILVLANGYPVHRYGKNAPSMRIVTIDQVLKPLKGVNISDMEVTCLKALVLLNPHGLKLVEPERVQDMQFQVQLMLEDYIKEQPLSDARGRLSQMLLALLPLISLREDMKTVFKLARIAGIPLEDNFVRAICLDGESSGSQETQTYNPPPASELQAQYESIMMELHSQDRKYTPIQMPPINSGFSQQNVTNYPMEGIVTQAEIQHGNETASYDNSEIPPDLDFDVLVDPPSLDVAHSSTPRVNWYNS